MRDEITWGSVEPDKLVSLFSFFLIEVGGRERAWAET